MELTVTIHSTTCPAITGRTFDIPTLLDTPDDPSVRIYGIGGSKPDLIGPMNSGAPLAMFGFRWLAQIPHWSYPNLTKLAGRISRQLFTDAGFTGDVDVHAQPVIDAEARFLAIPRTE